MGCSMRRIRPISLGSICFLLFIAPQSFADEPFADEPLSGDNPWKVRIELSYVNTSGNTDTRTLAGKLAAKKEGAFNRYYLDGSYFQTESEGEETSNKLKLEGRFERVVTKRLFGLFSAGYFRDKFSGYDFRAFGGPGLGIDLIKTDRHGLQVLTSLLYYHDELSAGEESTDDYAAGKATARYEWRVLENLKIKETLDYFVSFEDTQRSFIDSVTSAEVKINTRLSLGLSYIVNYQNAPPSPDIEHTDITFLTTLIIDF
jgi:putative salt-induced outer membrane protein